MQWVRKKHINRLTFEAVLKQENGWDHVLLHVHLVLDLNPSLP